MTTIISQSELVRRAAAFVAERFAEKRPPSVEAADYRPPEKTVIAILDEAGMRFNLSPAETTALYALFYNKDK